MSEKTSPPTRAEDLQKSVRIGSVATAVPPFKIAQQLASRLLTQHYSDTLRPRSLNVMQKVLEHPSIRHRYLSVRDGTELLSLKDEDPDIRMDRFAYWATELSAGALRRALDAAHLAVEDLSAVVVNTCTGYLCPGIATYLVERMDIPRTTPVYDLVGSGCGGAIPNIQLGEQIVRNTPGGAVACISVEICTATYQMGDDIALIISNAIFGDGAAAAIVWDRPEGPSLVTTRSLLVPENREDVRYHYKGGQLHNYLSPQLPKIVGAHVPRLIEDALAEYGLTSGSVPHWAVHPGGDRMVQTLQEKLALTDEQLETTREILRDYGNMSSPTVLFELKRLMQRGIPSGEWGVMVAFGAGMSIHLYLIRG
jgi:alkylresorcinol/alkylpyrone synthase